MLKRFLMGVPSERKRKSGRRRKIAYSTASDSDESCDIDLITHEPGIQRKQIKEEFDTTDKNVDLKKQRAAEDSNGVDKRVESLDYISQLPEFVIHLILSLLGSTKDAARTSILSKRWRDMWTSFSVLTCDQRKFRKLEEAQNRRHYNEMFKDFVDRSLQSHLERNIGIYKFVLHLTSYDAHHMERWIELTTENNIKELGVHVHKRGTSQRDRCILPRTVFAAETVTALRLEGCKLETCSIIKLPHLQKVYLRNLCVDKQIVQNLISSCPLIEDLRLIHCTGLRHLKISGLLKLDRVEVVYCRGLKNIKIKAPCLLTFWYSGGDYMSCKINLVDCKSLKRLTLEGSDMSDNVFHHKFYSFPLLEKLDLSKCHSLKNVRIASHRLNRLVLRGCNNLEEAEIDTPNLLSFEYKGDKMPFSSLICSKEAKLSFTLEEGGQPLFQRLREFLGKFDHSIGLKLVVRSDKNVIIHEDLRDILLPPSNGLKLEIIKSSVSTEELLDSSFQKWHLETLSIVSPSSSEFCKLVHEKIMDRKEDPICCTSNNLNNKCWRHFLKGAKMVNFKVAKQKRESTWVAWLRSNPTDLYETTCFILNWKYDQHCQKACP